MSTLLGRWVSFSSPRTRAVSALAVGALRAASALLVGLAATSASAEGRSAREVFAYALGAAVVAQKNCNLPDEVQKAKAWVDSFQSGFDTWNNRDDAFLTMTTGSNVDAHVPQHRSIAAVKEIAAVRGGLANE